MAESKTKSGGGGLTWLIAGFLLGVAVTLGGLAFLSHEPSDGPAQAQSAVVAPPSVQPQAPGAQAPAAPATATAQTPATPSAEAAAPSVGSPMPAQPSESIDPDVADDAASVGMTSRAPPR